MTLTSEPVRVAEAIERLLGTPGGPDPLGLLSPEAADVARMCLAEALNNCIEHGYGGEPGHPIRVDRAAQLSTGRGVELRISDRGRRPPDAFLSSDAAPAQSAPDALTAAGAVADLPEGGMGWSMIRELTECIRFEQADGWNTLILETSGGF